MKRILSLMFVLALALGLSNAAYAQASYHKTAFPDVYKAYSDASFRICASTDTASPCTSVPIFTTAAMTATVTQPVTMPGDSKSAIFYAPAGIYNIQWYSALYGKYFTEPINVGAPGVVVLGRKQTASSTSITNNTATALSGVEVLVPAGLVNTAGKNLHVKVRGIYTNAAATTLKADVRLCTVSGCATGTVVAPAGCSIVSASQANNLTNGQFEADCELTTVTTGASGTFMAKGKAGYNIGANTAVALTEYADTATAVSAAVDLTVAEYINIFWTFGTGNAGNSVTPMSVNVELTN